MPSNLASPGVRTAKVFSHSPHGRTVLQRAPQTALPQGQLTDNEQLTPMPEKTRISGHRSPPPENRTTHRIRDAHRQTPNMRREPSKINGLYRTHRARLRPPFSSAFVCGQSFFDSCVTSQHFAGSTHISDMTAGFDSGRESRVRIASLVLAVEL
jgi:hypothetical protein